VLGEFVEQSKEELIMVFEIMIASD